MAGKADFISQIPNEVLRKTEVRRCGSIVLFRPMVYMGGIDFDVTDYHVVVPSENTPDALFNNKMIHGEQRKILVVNPGDTVSCLENAPAKPYYSFLIKAGLLGRIAEEMDFSGEIRFENFLNPFSGELFQALRSLERESARADRFGLMLESLEIQIATLLIREFRTNLKKAGPISQDADSYIRLAKEYIQAYFSSDITLDDICGEIHVSRYHFIRMFSRKVGLTPHRYLLKVRIEKAKELLDMGCYSVSEAAALSGFESLSHFSDTFRKSTGYSPAEYRKQR